MSKKIKENFKSLSKNEKIYAGTVLPLWLSFTIYLLIGVPIYMP